MGECVFCDIEAGTAPASVVYEDDRGLAFLDIRPVTFGHTLVIPRAPDWSRRPERVVLDEHAAVIRAAL